MAPRYTEAEAREAVAASLSYAEALRRMGMCDHGGSHRVLRKWVEIWDVPVDHFDPRAHTVRLNRTRAVPLERLLVEGSTIGSSHLKEKLYRAGLKERRCELCGQGEEWRGRRMSLILDHANGVRDDNRLENLRIVCPNCNATLETHCGRNAAIPAERPCARCSTSFRPRKAGQRYCSVACGSRWDRTGRPRPGARRVERPPYERLLAEVEQLGWEGTGRKYGVSGNAIRKWVRWYERERAREAA
ncbi:MAG TPA: hypothetical protein VN238_16030 [Solirubrobacteraceae bacterium]|nr:hypothetical protein [Solirubrobacteraceae bacterium]